MKKIITLSIAILSAFNNTNLFASTMNNANKINISKNTSKINLSNDDISELKTNLTEFNVEEKFKIN